MTLEEMAKALQEHCKKTKCDICQFNNGDKCLLYALPSRWALDNVNKRLREAVRDATNVLKGYCKDNDHCEGCMFNNDKDKYCLLNCKEPECWNIPKD